MESPWQGQGWEQGHQSVGCNSNIKVWWCHYSSLQFQSFLPRQPRESESLFIFNKGFFDHMLSSLMVHLSPNPFTFWSPCLSCASLYPQCRPQFLLPSKCSYIFIRWRNKTKFKTSKIQPCLDFAARYLILLVVGVYRDIITVQAPQPPVPQPYLVPVSRTGKSVVKDNVFSKILFLE